MKKLAADIQCPNCKRKISIKVEDMRPGTSKKCPSCSANLNFTGDDGRKIQRALDDLGKALRGF